MAEVMDAEAVRGEPTAGRVTGRDIELAGATDGIFRSAA
jgi:hypothetical protein